MLFFSSDESKFTIVQFNRSTYSFSGYIAENIIASSNFEFSSSVNIDQNTGTVYLSGSAQIIGGLEYYSSGTGSIGFVYTMDTDDDSNNYYTQAWTTWSSADIDAVLVSPLPFLSIAQTFVELVDVNIVIDGLTSIPSISAPSDFEYPNTKQITVSLP